tara:strand:- start:5093 stop:6280 length:1188 start_codon:yes stop_codon:yes gene_type:complete
MLYYTFKQNDTFYNRIETHPYIQFYINNSKVYYNNKQERAGAFATNEKMVPVGSISLYELNIDRPAGSLIYPFITKGGSRTAFKTVSTTAFNEFQYGATINGSYPLSASISRDYLAGGTVDVVGTVVNKPRLFALKNTLNYYKYLSRHYEYSSSYFGWDKGQQDMSLISIPSIFYGSSISKGTVDLKFYITGTLAAECKDIKKNGELVQTGPVGSTGSGSVAGVVLYNEGFVMLTGSWNLSAHQENYVVGGSNVNAKWIYFGTTGSAPTHTVPSSSFDMSFQGTNYVPVITMLAHAPKGELNHSSNPTYIEYGGTQQLFNPESGSFTYKENETVQIKNIVSSSYVDPTGSFEKQTFISRIGIYDKDKNLIGVAKVANPVKKTEDREFTFKLKLDI